MFKKSLAAAAMAILSMGSASAGVVYQFSFSNTVGTLSGAIAGTITLDFLNSAADSGIGQASDIRITSSPAGTPAAVEGANIVSWLTQVKNRFEVVNGQIVDYEFGAAEGSPSTLTDNVFCLNNGPQFSFPVHNVYMCGANENYYGDARAYVYNTDGIQAVSFRQQANSVPRPGTLSLVLLATGMLGIAVPLARKQATEHGSRPA